MRKVNNSRVVIVRGAPILQAGRAGYSTAGIPAPELFAFQPEDLDAFNASLDEARRLYLGKLKARYRSTDYVCMAAALGPPTSSKRSGGL